MIDIYTRSNSLLSKEFWKWTARRLLHKYSGPQAVEDSLLRGLTAHNIPYTRNAAQPTGSVALVLSGVDALTSQLQRRKAGKIQKLLAGPNIVTTPHEAHAILCDTAIDHILVPSQWVADYYTSVAPTIAEKIVVWPAGVASAAASTRERIALIYNKHPDAALSSEAAAAADTAGYEVHTISYGSHTRKAYLEALTRADVVVYISPSESQGIALQEAWMRDVPTFVHYTGITETSSFTWQDPLINAPYLTDQFGALYHNMDELSKLLSDTKRFHPKQLCETLLSDTATVEKLLPFVQ